MRERVIEIQSDERLVVTVAQQPEPQPVKPTDGGEKMYTVGTIGDSHFDTDDKNNSEYMKDLQNALRFFEREGVDAVNSVGDLCQYKDNDLVEFEKAYDSRLPFYTCMGNHDYLRIYEKKDAAHPIPSQFLSAEDMWDKTVRALAKGAEVHYLGTTFKDKLNFWYENKGDLFVFISVDYGESRQRYDVIRAINRLDYNSKYVQQMTEYVKDTKYDRTRETNFDYQFYNPKALIWLKNLVEANPTKRIVLHIHHFQPNGSGDTFSVYRHLRIYPIPTLQEIDEFFYSGSNTLCGLEFWFIDKLLRMNRNIICCGGHSHFKAKEQEDIITRAYNVTQPTGKEVTPHVDDINSLNDTQYDYQIYRYDGHSYSETAPTVHIPSLAKPSTRYGTTEYGASEGMLMEMCKDKVILKYIRFKAEGSKEYTNEVIKTVELSIANDSTPVVVPADPEPEPEPSFKGIKVVFTNKTGEEIRFAGKYHMYTKEDKNAIPLFLCPPANEDGGYAHWAENPYTLKNGASMEFVFNVCHDYIGDGTKVTKTTFNISDFYGKHFRTEDTAVWPAGIPAIKFGVYSYGRHDKGTGTGAAMIHAVPVKESNCLIKEGGVYDVILDEIKENATLNKEYAKIPYKDGDKYKYVIM